MNISKIRPNLPVCLFLAVSVLIVYWQVRHYEFVSFDDVMYVTENRHVRAGLTPESVSWAFNFTDKEGTYWQPLTWLSHMLDCHLYGLNAGMHHWTSLMIHIANSLLLFFVFRRMTGEIRKSAFMAALFALHPLNVDSVAWVAERKNVLSTFFWILTMLAYVRYTEQTGLSRYIQLVSAFSLGLMTKPMLVTLPFALLLLDYWPLGRLSVVSCQSSVVSCQSSVVSRQSSVLLEKIPLFVLSAVSVGISSLSLQHYDNVTSTHFAPMTLRIENALVSYIAYLWKMIWPRNLSVYYPYPETVPVWQTLGAVILLVGISLLIIRKLRQMPYLTTGWLWYLGTLVPVSGLMQTGLWPAMADRWAYIPLIGIFAMIAWGVPQALANLTSAQIGKRQSAKKGLVIISTAVILILMTVSRMQVRHWADSITLFRHAIDVTSDNYVAHNHLGGALAARGKFDEAITHYSESLRINPGYLRALNNLGLVLAKQDKTDEAISLYSRILQTNPAYMPAHINMGLALSKQNRITEAIGHYSQALDLEPDHFLAHKNMGILLLNIGKYEKGIIHFQEALRAMPNHADVHHHLARAHNNLGIDFANQGKTGEAIRHFSKALRSDATYAEAYYNMGVALANQGRTGEAIRYYSEALALTPDDAEIHNNMGVALLGMGNIRDATRHFQNALQKNPDHAEARGNLKKALTAQENFDKAVTIIQEKLEIAPENPELYHELGNLYRKHGQTDAATEQYQKALSVRPDFADSLHSLAIMYAMKGKYDQAISLLKKETELRPDHAETYYSVASIYARQNKTEQSVNWLKKAIEKGFDRWERIKTDVNLENIRNSSDYKEMIKDY
ncbi:tetratricopeptide repeat protein [Desulfobacterales bacterium HSG2]|nr:tetratricopeptide repeat protein [Desulfobacterales bacterium HSG2]